MPKPIWLDNNVLAEIDKGTKIFENEIFKLAKEGNEMLITEAVELEFLHGQKFNPADTVRRKALLDRLPVKIDKMANQIPMKQLRQLRDAATKHGLSIPDANVVAQIKASAQARGVQNPVFLTGDKKAIAAMRRNGVMAVKFKPSSTYAGATTRPAPAVPPAAPAAPPATPSSVPAVTRSAQAAEFLKRQWGNIKDGLKHGVKGAFSAANLASMVPDVILFFADRAAVKDAIKNIQLKFLKEGFAKGVAAGIMVWTEDEVQLNLLHRVTDYRVKGMGDAAGKLKLPNILRLAEETENYAVYVGYHFSYAKSNEWKEKMRAKGLAVLVKYNYAIPKDPRLFFEYEFIDKLAHMLRPATNEILEPHIKFG
jgi:hypothetical protein